jgi:hypothetical protein
VRRQLEISFPAFVLFAIVAGTMSFHFQKKELDLYPPPAKHRAKCFGFTHCRPVIPVYFDAPFQEDGRFRTSTSVA